jgi:hypothetical protein
VFTKLPPRDPTRRVLGVPNRWLMVLGLSCFSVFVELLLYGTACFHWHYAWWNERAPWLIIVFGYATFYAAAAHVHDLPTMTQKRRFTGALAGTAAVLVIVFGPTLGWI